MQDRDGDLVWQKPSTGERILVPSMLILLFFHLLARLPGGKELNSPLGATLSVGICLDYNHFASGAQNSGWDQIIGIEDTPKELRVPNSTVLNPPSTERPLHVYDEIYGDRRWQRLFMRAFTDNNSDVYSVELRERILKYFCYALNEKQNHHFERFQVTRFSQRIHAGELNPTILTTVFDPVACLKNNL